MVEAELSARPVVPSAMQPCSVHPEGKGDLGLMKLGVGGTGSQEGLGPIPTQRRLQPGRTVRGTEALPMLSFTIGISGLHAEAAS